MKCFGTVSQLTLQDPHKKTAQDDEIVVGDLELPDVPSFPVAQVAGGEVNRRKGRRPMNMKFTTTPMKNEIYTAFKVLL